MSNRNLNAQEENTQFSRANYPQLFEKGFWFMDENALYLPLGDEDEKNKSMIAFLRERDVQLEPLETTKEEKFKSLVFNSFRVFPSQTPMLKVEMPESIFNLFTNFFHLGEDKEHYYYLIPQKVRDWYEQKEGAFDEEIDMRVPKEGDSVLNKTSQSWYKALLTQEEFVQPGVLTPIEGMSEEEKKTLVRTLEEQDISGVIVDARQHEGQIPMSVLFVPSAQVPDKTKTQGNIGSVFMEGEVISLKEAKERMEQRKTRQAYHPLTLLQKVFNF